MRCTKSSRDKTHVFDIALVECVDVLPHWCCKGVVRAAPASMGKKILVGIVMREKRELCDPEEVRIFGDNHIAYYKMAEERLDSMRMTVDASGEETIDND